MTDKLILTVMVLGWLGVSAGLWGEYRYRKGYETAKAQAQRAQQEAERRLREREYRASQTYQAAKAQREAAEQLRKGQIYEITQRADYSHFCFDADGLRELNATTGKK